MVTKVDDWILRASNNRKVVLPLPCMADFGNLHAFVSLSRQVVGMRSKDDPYPVKLGSGVYDIDGRPIQTFPIE